MQTCRISCSFGDDPNIVTVKLGGHSQPIVAGILGIESGNDGKPKRVYLNSLITRYSKDTTYSGWIPSGAISTILTREDP